MNTAGLIGDFVADLEGLHERIAYPVTAKRMVWR